MRLNQAALAAGMLLAASIPATAQGAACGPWQQILSGLHQRFGELPAFIAVDHKSRVLTVTVNPETSTFTAIVQADPNTMCIVASGENWGAASEAVKDSVRRMGGEGA